MFWSNKKDELIKTLRAALDLQKRINKQHEINTEVMRQIIDQKQKHIELYEGKSND